MTKAKIDKMQKGELKKNPEILLNMLGTFLELSEKDQAYVGGLVQGIYLQKQNNIQSLSLNR